MQEKSLLRNQEHRLLFTHHSLKQHRLPQQQALLVRARIGLDESGKGDYFGALVIGAVFVDVKTEERLVALGVRDSKLLSDNRIIVLAEQIKVLCPHFVVPIEPKRYNELYAKVKNSQSPACLGTRMDTGKFVG